MALTKEQISGRVSHSFRGTNMGINATISLGLLDNMEKAMLLAKELPPYFASKLLIFALNVGGPAGFLQNTLLSAGSRWSWTRESAVGHMREQMLHRPASNDTRHGTEAQSDYIADKISRTVPAWRQGAAALGAGIGLGLRQNFITQFAFNNFFLTWATIADGAFYGLRKITGIESSGRRWQLRNTTKALLMNLGTIAPAGGNLEDIVQNSLYQPKYGRFAWEKARIGTVTNARQAFKPRGAA